MAVITAQDIADLVTTTLDELGRQKWTEISTELQDYPAMRRLIRREKIAYDSGKAITFNVATHTTGSAQSVGMFHVDDVNVADRHVTGTVPWRHWTGNYGFEVREFLMNTGAAQIVDLVKSRRIDCMIDLAKHGEAEFWSKPIDSTDKTQTYGVEYWIVFNGNNGNGFTGVNPDGFLGGAAGLDASLPDLERWRNGSYAYTAISKPDFIAKLREAYVKAQFRAPVDGIPDYNTGNRYGLYCGYQILGKLETELEKQNQNLGNDVAAMDGRTMFRRVPIEWVPQLDSDPRDLFYGLNWGVFKPTFLRGDDFRETPPTPAANQHNAVHVHVDATLNNVCRDRRANFVLGKAA